MKLSILTATYNRANMLKIVYKSILDNLNYGLDVEWIIIDDGSVDNTKNIVKQIKEENKFEIKYIWQENSGKMKAINKGIQNVTGELIVDCDSDDFFLKESFKTIFDNVEYLFSKNDIYAMCFLKKDINRKYKREYI